MKLRDHLYKIEHNAFEKWGECIVFTVGAIGLGYLFRPEDPLMITGHFPWTWFVSVLIALRYGLAPALVSAGLITLSLFAFIQTGLVNHHFPIEYALGGIILTLVCGQFSSVWIGRMRRANLLSAHAGERFEQISRAYFMVRLSHDRLEQNLISKPVTLREAISEIRTLLGENGGKQNSEPVQGFMSILVHYCSLDSAAIYPVATGSGVPKPYATCGKGAPWIADDPLLEAALETGNTTYQTVNRLKDNQASNYLVAAPLTTSSGKQLAVLLVQDMPFLALQRETLQIMGVLLAYFADHVHAARSAAEILSPHPDCPIMFAAELIKLWRLKRDLDIVSSLAMIRIGRCDRMEEIVNALERQQRGLDHVWKRHVPEAAQLVTLMPFAGPAAVEGFLARTGETLKKNFGVVLGKDDVTWRTEALSSSLSPLGLIERLVEEQRRE